MIFLYQKEGCEMGGKKDKSTWERRMDKAQKEHRPSLKDWER